MPPKAIWYLFKTQDFNPLNLFSFTHKTARLTQAYNNVLSTRLELWNYAATPSQTEKGTG